MKAFPNKGYIQDSDGILGEAHFSGMDLRDYFAAHAPIEFTDLNCVLGIHWDDCSGKELIEALAQARYHFADAMIKSREQK